MMPPFSPAMLRGAEQVGVLELDGRNDGGQRIHDVRRVGSSPNTHLHDRNVAARLAEGEEAVKGQKLEGGG